MMSNRKLRIAAVITACIVFWSLCAFVAAQIKVSALPAATAVTTDDLLLIVDDPLGTAASKKITVANFKSSIFASPTLVTPVLGVASATSLNGNTFTTGTYTLTGAAGKTLTFSNTLTFTGTDASSVAFGAGGTVLYGNQSITLSGDVSGSGATAITAVIGATKVTSAMLNADVFSTAHSWGGQQTFTAPALGTPASGVATNITGLPPTTGIVGWPANAVGALTNNGAGVLSWAAAGGSAAGSDTQVQFNDGGTSFGGDAGLVYNKTTNVLSIIGGGLLFSGDQSAATWTTNGLRIKGVAATFTDTTAATGTTATAYTDVLGGNTIAATNSGVIFTNYFTAYIKDPIAGTNVTLTNKWAIGGDSMKIGTNLLVPAVASGVDGLTITGAATANPANVTIAATGSDSNINILLTSKGSGQVWNGAGGAFKGSEFQAQTSSYASDAAGAKLADARLYFSSTGLIGWTSTAVAGSSDDTGISRVSAGVVGIGTGAQGSTAGNLSLTNLITAATASTGTGVIIDGSNVLRPLTSSLRFKTNVRDWHPSDEAMNAFLSLNPINFRYKQNDVGDIVGFSAEGLASVDRELVNLDKDGLPYSTREHAILAYLHEIVRKQQSEINELKARVH